MVENPTGDKSASTSPEAFWVKAWAKLRDEPAQAAALAYFWLVAVGFAHLFGSGMAFDINIIDLASPGDFLVAGLRDPFVAVLAGLTGLFLYTRWGSWRESPRKMWWLALLAIALLAICACLSGAYRHAVVLGSWRTWPGSPQPLTVTLSRGEDGKPEVIECARIGVATADFVVVGVDPCHAHDPSRIVVARGEIRRFAVREQGACSCRSASR
jgi:hypothetical protein